MAKFMMLFRANPEVFQTMSPEQMQKVIQKWSDWRESLQKSGHLKQLGERLEGGGKVVRGKSKAITDGPYAESKDLVLGHMSVEAKDIAEASQIATGCPILDGDGSVEIRPVMIV